MKVEKVKVTSLTMDPENARKHSERNIKAIAGSLEAFGQRRPLVVWDNIVIAGNGTLEAAKSLGWDTIEITRVPADWDYNRARAYALADNRTAELAEWNADVLAEQLIELDSVGYEIEDWGFEPLEPPTDPISNPEGIDLAEDMEQAAGQRASVSLADTYGVPPFSVLDQRSGHWQERKRAWISLGIKSEQGRGDALAYKGQDSLNKLQSSASGVTISSLSGRVPNYYFQKTETEERLGRSLTNDEFEREHLEIPEDGLSSSGTSVFDPVLTELLISWFSPADGHILDPFAGGSVRGIIAAALGRRYTGIELRDEQVRANRQQAADILPRLTDPGSCDWIIGDSNEILPTLTEPADMILSCPPYADLEVYSDDPADISSMPYPDFLTTYRSIIARSVDRLADNRFIAWVVGDVRDNRGNYRGLIPDTITAFEDAGASYYNEGILVSPIGSLAFRLNRQFQAGRKFGKAHQNVLVFVKGDGKKATQNCGPVILPKRGEGE